MPGSDADYGDVPDLETLERWAFDGVAETPDGCSCEPDGECEHGESSWLVILGYI